jgi:hypothetical protein
MAKRCELIGAIGERDNIWVKSRSGAIHFALASELAQAKDLQNVLTLQSRYA